MKILAVQESDWFERGPLQQHHLFEKTSLQQNFIKVIDYELLWSQKNDRPLYSKRTVFESVSRIYKNSSVEIIRPGIIKIPILDYISLLFTRWNEIRKQIREFNPDVVIGFFMLNAVIGLYLAKRNKIPFIYYWIDVYHTQVPYKLFRPVGQLIEMIVLKNSDQVMVINDQLKNYVVKLGASAASTFVVKGTVDSTKFSLDQEIRISIRKKYNFKDDDIVLFFVGVLYTFTGLKEVASQLVQMPANYKLLIVGEGDIFNDLKELRDSLGLQDRLILTGKRPYEEVPGFISVADICILPADAKEKIMQEIVPIKMYEYMALSKPVISTKLPGVMREFGEDNGVVYAEDAESVLTQAITLIDNNQLSELGRRARQFVERNSWDNITDEFEEHLKSAIADKLKV
jgi:glycosyltransferase involved in cell wall biosynthesis